MMYLIDKRESNRITCLRALCVIFVIFLHQYAGDVQGSGFVASGTIPNNVVLQGIQYVISRIITFSAVPLFFMLSSILLYAKEFTWKSNMKKKLKALVIPYFLWISIYIFVYFLGQTIPFTSSFFGNAARKVVDMRLVDIFGAYTGIGVHGLFVNSMWFLRDLIILNLLAPLLKRIINRFPLVYFVMIFLLWNCGSIPRCLILNNQSIVFFSLGYYVVKYNIRMTIIDKISSLEIVFIYLVTIASEFYFYKLGNPLKDAVHSFSSIIGIVLLIKVSGLLIDNKEKQVPKVLGVIASTSFFVYASHDFIQTVFKKVCAKLFIQTDVVQMVEYFVIPLLVCGVCTCIAMFVKRRMSLVYNILTGARKSLN